MRALVLCLSDASRDPRARRTIETLAGLGWRVEVLSQPPSGTVSADRVHPLPVAPSRRIRTALGMLVSRVLPMRDRVIAERFNHAEIERVVGDCTWELVVVEHVYLLPLAFRIRADRVVFDAREYFPSVGVQGWAFRLLQRAELIWICRQYLARCDAVVTVSPGIADEYAREFGVRPVVVRSIPNRQSHQVNPVDAAAIKVVHHGVANRERRLERLVEMFEALDERYSLDLYLTPRAGDTTYLAELMRATEGIPRVRVLPPVPVEQIGQMLNRYDVGLHYLEPTSFNLEHCLPNKLFEYIQARLAVAIGPSPDMAAVVRQYDCGVVADDFTVERMTAALAALTPEQIMAFKHNSDAAARTLCFEVERELLERVLVGA